MSGAREMSESSRIPVLVMLLFVMAVQLLALAVTPAISASDNRVFADPTSTSNPFVYMLLILAFTALLLLAIKNEEELDCQRIHTIISLPPASII